MEKEKSNPYTFFILRYRLVNLQGGIFAFEKEKNYGRRKNRKRSIGKLNSPYRLSGIYLVRNIWSRDLLLQTGTSDSNPGIVIKIKNIAT